MPHILTLESIKQMKSLPFFVFAFLVLCAPVAGFAQIDTSRSTYQNLRNQIARGSYFSAIPVLEGIRKVYPGNQKFTQLLGEAYQEARLPAKAASTLESAYNPKAKGSAKLLVPIIQNYYNAGNYDKAKIWIDQLDKRRDADGTAKARGKFLSAAMDEISKADSVSSRFQLDTNFRFPNSGYADFSPVRMNDSTLVFSSLRQDSVASFDPAVTNFLTTRIYVYRQSDLNFDHLESPRILTPPGVHSGNGSFTPDGRHFYFTRCLETESGKLNCAIYLADVVNGKFENIRKLDGAINKPGSSNSQPFVVTTTVKNTLIETLYFVSDRKGGAGGKDIWVSTYNLKKRKFGNAANLGRLVNSAGNDQSPCLDEKTGHLYFTSDYHPGFGGYDVFLSRKAGNGFGKPINLGKPVNSMGDDSYFQLNGGHGAFLSSNRAGSHVLDMQVCCEDVFYCKRLPYLDSLSWVAYQKTVREPKKPDAVIPQMAEINETKTVVAPPTVMPEPKVEEIRIGKLDLKTKNDSKGVNLQTTILMKSISQNIQFEPGSNTLTTNTLPHLDSLASFLKQNPIYRLTLTGHTDNKGSKALNLRLSKTRAEKVKSYLVSKGADQTRIATVAKGPLVPLFPNQRPDGSDYPEGRAKNRRVSLDLKKVAKKK